MEVPSINMQNKNKEEILVFSLDEPRYALYLYSVERVVHAVEITPLPKAPEIVQGIINLHGEIIPVIDIRRRFNLPSRGLEPEDQFIIARTAKRQVALITDSVVGIHELKSDQIADTEQELPYAEYISGVAKTEDNLILITDLEKFLSLDEEKMMDKAIENVKND